MPQSLKDAFLKINPDSSKLLTMFNKDKERMLNFKDWKDEDIHSIKSPTLIIMVIMMLYFPVMRLKCQC